MCQLKIKPKKVQLGVSCPCGQLRSSEGPEEAVMRSVVHRHVEVQVHVGELIVDGQVGQRRHVGGGDGLHVERLGRQARQHDLRGHQQPRVVAVRGASCRQRGLQMHWHDWRGKARHLVWDGL